MEEFVIPHRAPWNLPSETHFNDRRIGEYLTTVLDGKIVFVHGLGWFAFDQVSPTAARWTQLEGGTDGAMRIVGEAVDEWVTLVCNSPSYDDGAKRKAATFLNRGKLSALSNTLADLMNTVPQVFDLEPWKVNTQSGVLDLLSGVVEASTPSQMNRHMCDFTCDDGVVDAAVRVRDAVESGLPLFVALYDACGDNSRFVRFLEETHCGDGDLAAYVWRLAGSCMCGDGPGERFHVAIGSGANGKSVQWNIVQRLLGSYAQVMNSTVISSPWNTGSNGRGLDSMWLIHSCRMVFFPEIPFGALNEQNVKVLTSGEPVVVNKKYANEAILRNSGKCVGHANVAPLGQPRDGGFMRRWSVVPYNFKVAPKDIDLSLQARLLGDPDELRAAVVWLVSGAMAYATRSSEFGPGFGWLDGGDLPSSMVDAQEDYLSRIDVLGRFVKERCVVGEGKKVLSTSAFASYTAFCSEEGVKVSSKRAFLADLKRFEVSETVDSHSRKRFLLGMGLLSDDDKYWEG